MTIAMMRSTEGHNGHSTAPGPGPGGSTRPERERALPAPGPARPQGTGAPLVAHLLAVSGALQVLAGVRSDRARLRLRRSLARVRGQVLGLTVLLVGAVYGTWFVASGLAQVLDGLFERNQGLGRLVAGLLLLSSGAVWLRVRGTLRARHDLNRLVARYARHATEPAPAARSTHQASPTPHGRSAPR